MFIFFFSVTVNNKKSNDNTRDTLNERVEIKTEKDDNMSTWHNKE